MKTETAEDVKMEQVKVAVVYFSKYGHTKLQAEAVADGATGTGAQVLLLAAPEAIARLDELDGFDAIVFGTATYMGNISAGFKEFMEVSVKKWFSRSWQDKVAGGFTNSSNFSGDKSNTLAGLVTFAMQHGMIWVGLGDLVAGNAHETLKRPEGPGPEAINRVSGSVGAMACSFELKAPDAPGAGDLETARRYGRRIAEVALRLKRGGVR